MTPGLCARLLCRPNYTVRLGYNACRTLSSSLAVSAGHNKWSQIKHDKAKNDRAKARERQLVGKEICSAARMWGPDPKFNPRLTLALSNARRASIPKVIIEAAIARGQGKSLAGNTLEPITIEAMLPHSVAAVIECMAEVKGRVLQDIRHAVKEMGGSVTPTTYLFEKKGRIIFERRDGLNPDDYLDQAIEAGAADIAADDSGRLIAFTETTQTKHVGETLASLTGLTIEELEIIWDPNRDTLVSVDEDQAMDVEHMLGILREDTSVRDIYLNTATKF